MRIDNIYKIGEGKYQAVAFFFQKFVAYREGCCVYGLNTVKKVIVYANAIEPPTGIVGVAKLGDIYVASTGSGD